MNPQCMKSTRESLLLHLRRRAVGSQSFPPHPPPLPRMIPLLQEDLQNTPKWHCSPMITCLLCLMDYAMLYSTGPACSAEMDRMNMRNSTSVIENLLRRRVRIVCRTSRSPTGMKSTATPPNSLTLRIRAQI
uniref:Uncharacterized protein n=1 Tax=Cacopsylla melanoneura TaxID=428564 RepID=A0A8D8SX02_9HEMI